MADTIEGGAYRRGDGWVNAEGKEIKAPSKGAIKKARSTTSTEAEVEPPAAGPLDGINFASDEAAEAAAKAGLTAEKFAGVTGSGSGGAYTMADVKKLGEPPAA